MLCARTIHRKCESARQRDELVRSKLRPAQCAHSWESIDLRACETGRWWWWCGCFHVELMQECHELVALALQMLQHVDLHRLPAARSRSTPSTSDSSPKQWTRRSRIS